MTLYEIDKTILNCFDMETGEILDEEQLEQLQMDRKKKIENTALFVKNLEAEAEAYKKEKLAFDERQKRCEAKVKQLKAYLQNATFEENFKTDKVEIKFRTSHPLKIEEDAVIPDEYYRVKKELNKTAIKDAIKNGAEIKGCSIEDVKNISIK